MLVFEFYLITQQNECQKDAKYQKFHDHELR